LLLLLRFGSDDDAFVFFPRRFFLVLAMLFLRLLLIGQHRHVNRLLAIEILHLFPWITCARRHIQLARVLGNQVAVFSELFAGVAE
jgi:hypothetical protein